MSFTDSKESHWRRWVAQIIGGAGTLTGNFTVSGNFTVNGTVVILDNLPTSDPLNAGQLWNNSGVLTVSAG